MTPSKTSHLPNGSPFATFTEYKNLLVRELEALADNAKAEGRNQTYRLVASVSSGFDSAASAVIARDAGGREAYTFAEASAAPPGTSDSGAHIARQLGLDVTTYHTESYKQRDDIPEAGFVATGYGGPQVYISAAEQQLRGAINIAGFGGDFVWQYASASSPSHDGPLVPGGFSNQNFELSLPTLTLAVPMIGARHTAALARLSWSAEMEPFRLGGDYDRPLPRRILEEAGVPRGAFATEKKLVTTAYESVRRGRLPLENYLSPTSLRAFETWYATHAPYSPRYIRWRNRLVKFADRRLALERWPLPSGTCESIYLKSNLRPAGFLFHWAMDVVLPPLRQAARQAGYPMD